MNLFHKLTCCPQQPAWQKSATGIRPWGGICWIPPVNPTGAFSFLYDPDLGYIDLLQGSLLYRTNLNTRREDIYSVVGNNPVNPGMIQDSLNEMRTLTKAFYETARYMLLNNKKKTGGVK